MEEKRQPKDYDNWEDRHGYFEARQLARVRSRWERRTQSCVGREAGRGRERNEEEVDER